MACRLVGQPLDCFQKVRTRPCPAFKKAQTVASVNPTDPKSDRRGVLIGGLNGALFAAFGNLYQASAFTPPPPGLRFHEDKLDGYSFLYPDSWLPVTSSGNDVFYRNPFIVDENLFVDVSSPSSSKYDSVEDLGTPDEAAKRTLEQYLEEFMSTRLGVRRTGEVISASLRTGKDGRLYYDIQTRVKSYASRNQLAVTQAEIDQGVEMEWDRRYLSVLGVANHRLYSFRIQTANSTYESDSERLLTIADSFRCREVV